MPTSKALVISVGTGKDRSGTPSLAEAIKFSIAQHNPTKVFFVVTKESREVTLPLILDGLDYENEIMEVDDPDNFNSIYESLSLKIEALRNSYDNLAIDYTSGTKPISAALATLGVNFEADTLSYISGKRSPALVQQGTEQIVMLRPYLAAAAHKYMMAVGYFNNTKYDAARSIINSILIKHRDKTLEDMMKPLDSMAEAYSLWDKFRHKEAYGKLSTLKIPGTEKNKEFLGKLMEQLEKTQSPDKGYPEPYMIADLINNSERRGAEEKKYDDAVARLYRTAELTAQYRLKKKYDIETSSVDPRRIPEELRSRWWGLQLIPAQETVGAKGGAEQAKSSAGAGRVPSIEPMKIDLKKDYELLHAFGDELGGLYCEDHEMKELLKTRNLSILAHGLQPVDEGTYIKLDKKVRALAKVAVNDLDKLLESSKFIKWPSRA